MALTWNKGTKLVTTTDSDIFTPIVEENYFGMYIYFNAISTNDIIITQHTWNDTTSQYEVLDRYSQTGLVLSSVIYIPLLPVRRFKVTIKRTSGVGANTDYTIQYDIAKQTG